MFLACSWNYWVSICDTVHYHVRSVCLIMETVAMKEYGQHKCSDTPCCSHIFQWISVRQTFITNLQSA